MSNVLFIGWNYPKVGRERQAGELFNASIAFWKKQIDNGRIESFEPVLLGSHGGTLNGFFMIRGTGKNLDEIRRDDDFLKLVMQLNLAVDGVGVVAGWHGEELMEIMNRWTKII